MPLSLRPDQDPLKSRFETKTYVVLQRYWGNCLDGPRHRDRVSSVVMDIAHLMSLAALPVTTAARGTIICGSEGHQSAGGGLFCLFCVGIDLVYTNLMTM